MNLERLHILYEHLMTGKLRHETFDFGHYNIGLKSENRCGTIGCAIGECPVIWKEWHFDKYNDPTLRRLGNSGNEQTSGEKWFGLVKEEYYHLFVPNKQVTGLYGGILLTRNATRKQVASNIKSFINECYKVGE